MPNYFTLTRKNDLDAGPVKLSLIDEELCAAFNEPIHKKDYFCDWYNSIGFRLACGKSFAEIIEEFEGYSEEYYVWAIHIAKWLDENFTKNAWAQIGK